MIKYLDLKAINAPYEHAADEVLRSGWYLKGEATRQFEAHYADYIGTRYCIGCGNGLDALTLIFRAYIEMGVMKPGDEVIVPANTYIASILAVTECGLKPVLVEPDIRTLQIDDTLIESAITAHTRAVMIVHLYGFCAYTSHIADICRQHNLRLIEDNAQAHGCRFVESGAVPQRSSQQQSPRTGSLGDAAGHSFYPTKNLGAFGDAGAVTTNDEELATVIRAFGNYGSHKKYVFDYLGRNSRIDELQAAILDAKLPHLDADNQRRCDIADIYLSQVHNPLIRLPQASPSAVWHIFPVLCARRDELQQYLRDHGADTQIHYPIPPHKQKCYADWNSLSLPITEQIHAQELSIPCHPALTKEEADVIIDLLNQFV
jgi:dTDP-4-amino-4,6-dideoxygalactose transaminase